MCGADRCPRPESAFPDARLIDLSAGVWGYDVSLRLGKLLLNGGESPLPVVVVRTRKASDDRGPGDSKPELVSNNVDPASLVPLGALQLQILGVGAWPSSLGAWSC